MRSTSIEAYNALMSEGVLPKKRRQVYGWLHNYGPATAAEVEAALKSKDAHKRLPELRNQGIIEELGKRICTVTGRKVIEWNVNGLLPKET